MNDEEDKKLKGHYMINAYDKLRSTLQLVMTKMNLNDKLKIMDDTEHSRTSDFLEDDEQHEYMELFVDRYVDGMTTKDLVRVCLQH